MYLKWALIFSLGVCVVPANSNGLSFCEIDLLATASDTNALGSMYFAALSKVAEGMPNDQLKRLYERLLKNPFSLVDADNSLDTFDSKLLIFHNEFLQAFERSFVGSVEKNIFAEHIRTSLKVFLKKFLCNAEKQTAAMTKTASLNLFSKSIQLDSNETLLAIQYPYFLFSKKNFLQISTLHLKVFNPQTKQLEDHPTWKPFSIDSFAIKCQIDSTLLRIIYRSQGPETNTFYYHYKEIQMEPFKEVLNSPPIASADTLSLSEASVFFAIGKDLYFYTYLYQDTTGTSKSHIVALPHFTIASLWIHSSKSLKLTVERLVFNRAYFGNFQGIFVINKQTSSPAFFSFADIQFLFKYSRSSNAPDKTEYLASGLVESNSAELISDRIMAVLQTRKGLILIQSHKKQIQFIFRPLNSNDSEIVLNLKLPSLYITQDLYRHPVREAPHIAVFEAQENDFFSRPRLILERTLFINRKDGDKQTILVDFNDQEIRTLSQEWDSQYILDQSSEPWVAFCSRHVSVPGRQTVYDSREIWLKSLELKQ